MPNSPVTDSQQQASALKRSEDLPTPSGAAPSAIAERIDAERVRILYSVAPFNILIHVLASSVLAYAISGTVDGSLLAGWYAVMLLVCACCWALQHGYHDTDKLAGQARVWELRFAAAAFVTALVWSALLLFLFPAHSVPHQILIILVICSLAFGSAGAVQASMISFVAFVATTLLALFLRLMLNGQQLDMYAGLLLAASFPVWAGIFFACTKRSGSHCWFASKKSLSWRSCSVSSRR